MEANTTPMEMELIDKCHEGMFEIYEIESGLFLAHKDYLDHTADIKHRRRLDHYGPFLQEWDEEFGLTYRMSGDSGRFKSG